MARVSKSTLRRILIASCANLALTGVAFAQTTKPVQYELQSTDLGSALNQVARQSQQEIVFDAALARGKRAPALVGSYTPKDAVERLLSGSGLVVRTAASGSLVIEAAAPQHLGAVDDGAATVNEIVVTSTRVVRAGYSAPTPTTVVGTAEINAAAPATLADFINQLPALAGSYGTRVLGLSTGPNSGSNILNLRSLGPTRTLVLLDSRRVAPTLVTGQVDVNLLPQGLVKRVDIVTGGASADWGSDAVAGVVNFILDTDFTGLKLNVQGGQTERGDGKNYQAGLTYGKAFANDKGHFLFDTQISNQASGDRAGTRDWYKGYKVVANPAFVAGGTQPPQILASDVGLSQATAGGLIVTGPLRGVQFTGADGAPSPFNFGTLAGQFAVGSGAEDYGKIAPLQNPVRSQSYFTRASYEITPNVSAFGELSYAHSQASIDGLPYMRFANITIRNDNAYLDTGIRNQMSTLGLTNFTLGSTNMALGYPRYGITRSLSRAVVGLDGKFGDGWTWNAYYQHGKTDYRSSIGNDPMPGKYNLAVDAVRSPTTGAIVCRSTLTDPTNGCVPLNVFGVRTPSSAQLAYIMGTSVQKTQFTQDVAAASIHGEPINIWAGPVSIAAGVEYRRDKYAADADAQSKALVFSVGNFLPSGGEIEVTEGFVEAVVPLLKDATLAKNLDFNGAIRLTDYSTSGTVTTWKAGLTWKLNDDVHFRGTRSRDIRAGNAAEVFTASIFGIQSVADPVKGATVNITTLSQGNLSIEPEKADTETLGVVVQPTWLPGFSVSVDYYDVQIRNAILTPTAQQTVNGCVSGLTNLCTSVIRGADGVITQVNVQSQNVTSESESGVDIESSYRFNLDDHAPAIGGELSFRVLANWVRDRKVRSFGTVVDYAGTNADATNRGSAVPTWRGTASATWIKGQFTTSLTGRYIGSGVLSNVQPYIGNQDVDAVTYFDLYGAYRPKSMNGAAETFIVVQNLLDKNPPAAPELGSAAVLTVGTNGYLYDTLGRQFRAGIRLRF